MLSLLVGAALAGAEDIPVEPVEPAWVLVDRDTTLRLAPSDDAPKLHVATPKESPPHRPSPVLILLRVGRVDGWLRVRVARQPVTWLPDGRPAAPDVVPPTWTHCYPQAPGLQALDVGFWIREDDVLPVLTKPVTVEVGGGKARVDLSPGLAVLGGPGVRRVVGHHLSVIADVPAHAVGDSYPIGLAPPPSQAFVGVDGKGSFVLLPSFRPRVDLSGDAPRVDGTSAGGRTVIGLRDRCVDARLPSTPGVLAREAGSGERPRWPVLVPEGTAVGPRGAPAWGKVVESASVLWTTAGCTWDDRDGLCCADAAGLTLEGAADPAICFDVDLPTSKQDASLERVLGGRSEALERRAAAATGLKADVGVTITKLFGPTEAPAVEAGLAAELPRLAACYQRLLAEDPWLKGSMHVRFPIAPDGRGRTPQITSGDVVDVRLRDCVVRRLENVVVADQIGQVATIVDLDLVFRGVPSEPEATTPDQ